MRWKGLEGYQGTKFDWLAGWPSGRKIQALSGSPRPLPLSGEIPRLTPYIQMDPVPPKTLELRPK